jgi:hypothetical protein
LVKIREDRLPIVAVPDPKINKNGRKFKGLQAIRPIFA